MVHYHSHTRIIGRSAGRSAVAAAAYRAGEKLRNDYEECVTDFSRRSGVLHTEIMAPDGASPWVYNREELWNRVEASEKRKDAQLAREVELALPHELTDEQRLELIRGYVKQQFVGRGMVADIAIHKGHTDERNVHAHVLLSTREMLSEGFGHKVTEWNHPRNVKHWRREWARHQNRAYRDAGHHCRVDARSYKEQGINRRPQIHEGVKGRRMQRRDYQPGSKTVQRRTQSGKQRTIDYLKIDQGRCRVQRNAQIIMANRVRVHGNERVARAVEAHMHRRQLDKVYRQTRSAGKALGEVSKQARHAKWLAGRAAKIVTLHQERVQSLIKFAAQLPMHSGRLATYIVHSQVRLSRARNRMIAKRAQAGHAEAVARKAATQYRNLKSRLGGRHSDAIRAQVNQTHKDALRHISPTDIRNSVLSDTQQRDLLGAWHLRARERQRNQGRDRSD